MCVSVTFYRITPEEILAETPNLVFYICIRMDMRTVTFLRGRRNSLYAGTLEKFENIPAVDEISC